MFFPQKYLKVKLLTHWFQPWFIILLHTWSYVMIHVFKHDMDPNSYLSNSRKIAPMLWYDIMTKLCFDISIQFSEKWVFKIDFTKVLRWVKKNFLVLGLRFYHIPFTFWMQTKFEFFKVSVGFNMKPGIWNRF